MAMGEVSPRSLTTIIAAALCALLLLFAWLLVGRFGWASALLLGMLAAMVAQRAPMTERDPGNISEFVQRHEWTPGAAPPPATASVIDLRSLCSAARFTGFAIIGVSAVMFARRYF